MTSPGPSLRTGRPPGPPSMLGWGGAWQTMLIVAGAVFLLGLILLVWPHATVVVVAVLIGIALIITGVLRLVQGITAGEEGGARRAGYVVIGIVAGLAGLYCLRHISITVTVLAIVVGLYWAMHGVVDLVVAAASGPAEGRGLLAVSGVLSLIAGLLVLFWPSVSLNVVVAIIGVWLIFDGLLLAAAAWQVRRVSPATDSGPMP